jgi:nitroimidazol reductase NimA-like FMN-containing flavoprotein (pyridoxamine 5'-phosphate oxidase superfamily)
MEEKSSSEKQKHIYEILKAEGIGVISTVREGGIPDASLVYYIIQDDGTISINTRSETQKVKNITLNPHILLTVSRVATKEIISVRGEVRIEQSTSSELTKRLNDLAERHSNTDQIDTVLPLLKYNKGPIVFIHIKPVELLWQRYTDKGLEEEFVVM